MINKFSNKTKVITIFITMIILILCIRNPIGIWLEGISYISKNTKRYNDDSGRLLTEEYSIQIDLNNLKSNIDKELYNDGQNRIYVIRVEKTGEIDSGGHVVAFRSEGKYSLKGATLVSGIHHEIDEDGLYTPRLTAKLTTKYKGKTYTIDRGGYTGLNDKVGDEFLFFIFPEVAYNRDVTLDEKGKVELTITNLHKNIWTRN